MMPPGASAHAPDVDLVITLVHLLMLVLFVGWGAYFLWVLWRFRAARQPVAQREGAKGRLAFWTEVGVVVAESVLLVVIALPVWFGVTAARPDDADPVVVRVVGEQFFWSFHYPGADGEFGTTAASFISPSNSVGLDRRSPNGADDIVVIGTLHLPVDRPVVLQLSSKDVIHSFGVHALRVKLDVIPGLLSPMWFTPTAIGRYDIACSQLCGLGHYQMRGYVVVESEEDYAAFLAEQAATQTGGGG